MRRRQLHGAVVVITGASSGIGRATALAFASHRANLVLAARGPSGLADVERECAARGASVVTAPTDIASPHGSEELADRALERFGRVDVWVEAASLLAVGRLEDHPTDEVRALIDTNVTGTTLGARSALRVFGAQDGGTLIIVSSLLGLTPSPLAPVYGASKFATRGLALSLRRAVARQPGVEVCVVVPGPVDTPMFQRAANHTGRELRALPPAHAPERLAAAIVSCARRPRRQATAGLTSRALLLSHRLAPGVTDRLVAEWSWRLLTRSSSAPEDPGAVTQPRRGTSVAGGWRRGRLRRSAGERFGAWLATRRT